MPAHLDRHYCRRGCGQQTELVSFQSRYSHSEVRYREYDVNGGELHVLTCSAIDRTQRGMYESEYLAQGFKPVPTKLDKKKTRPAAPTGQRGASRKVRVAPGADLL